MKKRTIPLLAIALLAGGCRTSPGDAPASTADCAGPEWPPAVLTALRGTGFEGVAQPDQMALALANCLDHPDPLLRDETAYTGLTALLRSGTLRESTMRALFTRLVARLAPQATDDQGFGKPFAALALSEVVRVDRVTPYLSAAERDTVIAAAGNYLASIRDYRGFDPREGWRHGVAHSADIFMQLALNPELNEAQLLAIRTAIATQVIPADGHFYQFGESERLARPVLFLASRGAFAEHEWTLWLGELSARPEDAPAAFGSLDGLAWRHNLKAFLQVLFVNASLSRNETVRALLPGTEDTLRALP